MQKYVTVVFDRKKKAAKTRMGMVELQVRLSEGKRKYVGLMEIAPDEWPAICLRRDVQAEIERYEGIRHAMDVLGEPATLEVLNQHLGITSKPKDARGRKKKSPASGEELAPASFLDFMTEAINKEKLAAGTRKHKIVVIGAVKSFGKLEMMSDLTPQNIRLFDQWLRDTGERTDVTIYGYHKRLHKYVRMAYQRGFIDRDPYEQVSIPRGKSKERQPLTEEELTKLRNLKLRPKESKVRDLFVFSAYTGLAYCDTQEFDFEKMVEKHGKLYYIDGSRLKTGTKFFTPILGPAHEILKKYDYRLPHISNQKANDYLHNIESIMRLNKPLTFHVARHSFATLALSHDIPIEDVARMLGHTDIRTTKVYAKVLKSGIERHSLALEKAIK